MPENRKRTAATTVPRNAAELTIGEIPKWGAPVAEEFLKSILSDTEPFPCIFGVGAARKRTLRIGYVDGTDRQDDWSALPDLLRRYLEVYRGLGKDTSLVVFFRPEAEPLPLAAYRERFWAVLSYLAAKDAQPWPEDVPTDPDDPMWEFSFGGVPIFVVCNTPAHDRRRSRHADQFMITFQPRWVFEGLEADTPRGATSRRTIRRRLRAYDTVEPSPHLGVYGHDDNREWRQYFLEDDNHDNTASGERCPFHTGRARVTAVPAGSWAAVPAGSWAVVVNDAGEHSVWEAGREPPPGWRATGVTGTRDACLDHIAEAWPDPRPSTRRGHE
ncbi:YqcI/YcgG family protein [Spongiactinospora sp. 9N601]|uniref:YqcI/YcgG family protein n=1 Tax=Spongiactinospora sp. 9N601 TaxID=3375149 RepID=UPI0037A2C762